MRHRVRSFLACLACLAGDRRGSTLIEGSVVLPVFLALAFGVYEFSNLFYSYHLVTTGVRDAARYLARTDDPNASAGAGRNLATTATIDGTGARRVSWWAPADVVVNVATVANPFDAGTGERAYRGGPSVFVVTVQTSATYPGLGALTFLGLSPITFAAAHSERVIGD